MNNIKLNEIWINEDIVLIIGENKTGKSILLKQLSERLDLYNKNIYIDYRKYDREDNKLIKEIKEVGINKNKKRLIYIDNLGEGLDKERSIKLIEKIKKISDKKVVAATNNYEIINQINERGKIYI